MSYITSTGVIVNSYESGQQTITSGGLLTLAHGLATVPVILRARLECTTAEFNWLVGDFQDMPPQQLPGAAMQGYALYADDTNVYVRFGAATRAFQGLNKANGTGEDFTNANWAFHVLALSISNVVL